MVLNYINIYKYVDDLYFEVFTTVSKCIFKARALFLLTAWKVRVTTILRLLVTPQLATKVRADPGQSLFQISHLEVGPSSAFSRLLAGTWSELENLSLLAAASSVMPQFQALKM